MGLFETLFGGKSKTKSEKKQSAAPWEADQLPFWDEYKNLFLGQGGSFDDNLKGGYRGMLGEDTAAREQAGKKYVGDSRRAGSQFLDQSKQNLSKYDTDIENILSSYISPLKGTMGGKEVGITPGANQRAIANLTDVRGKQYDAQNQYSGKEKSVMDEMATRKLNQANTFTPNASDLAYLEYLMPLIMQMQGLRYSIPSSTTNTTESGQPGVFQALASVVKPAMAAYSAFSNPAAAAAAGGGEIRPEVDYASQSIDPKTLKFNY